MLRVWTFFKTDRPSQIGIILAAACLFLIGSRVVSERTLANMEACSSVLRKASTIELFTLAEMKLECGEACGDQFEAPENFSRVIGECLGIYDCYSDALLLKQFENSAYKRKRQKAIETAERAEYQKYKIEHAAPNQQDGQPILNFSLWKTQKSLATSVSVVRRRNEVQALTENGRKIMRERFRALGDENPEDAAVFQKADACVTRFLQ